MRHGIAVRQNRHMALPPVCPPVRPPSDGNRRRRLGTQIHPKTRTSLLRPSLCSPCTSFLNELMDKCVGSKWCSVHNMGRAHSISDRSFEKQSSMFSSRHSHLIVYRVRGSLSVQVPLHKGPGTSGTFYTPQFAANSDQTSWTWRMRCCGSGS